MRRWGSAAALAVALAAVAAAPASADDITDWAEARERWAVQDARDYTFRIRVTCFCPVREFVRVRVRDGKPRGTPRRLREFDTVEELFARIREEIGRGGTPQASYAKRTGVPRRFSADPVPQAVDDEYEITVRRIRITRRGR